MMRLLHHPVAHSLWDLRSSDGVWEVYPRVACDRAAHLYHIFSPMNYPKLPGNQKRNAPCIVNNGILVNQQDIQRLLSDLSRVRYIYFTEEKPQSEGVGYLKEVFSDPHRSTLIANCTIYLNLDSFDYLELQQTPDGESYFDLVQEDRKLRLIPLSNPLKKTISDRLNAAAIEAMMAEVLAASWDIPIDSDDENLSL